MSKAPSNNTFIMMALHHYGRPPIPMIVHRSATQFYAVPMHDVHIHGIEACNAPEYAQ